MKKKIIMGSLLLIGLLAAGLWVYQKSQPVELSRDQANKAASQILGRQLSSGANAKTGDIDYSGKYLTFSYPAAATIYQEPSTSSATDRLEYFSFDLINPRVALTASVFKNNTGTTKLDEYSGVKTRELNPDYTKADFSAGGQKGLVFTKDINGDGEKTAFLLFSGRVYILSATGSSLSDLSPVFDRVAASLNFR